jgi:N-acetylglutamate synthase-like GNAT family acetyltransferase
LNSSSTYSLFFISNRKIIEKEVVSLGTVVRFANQEDILKVLAYLKEAKLGTSGVSETIESFLIMEDENKNIKATVGIEKIGNQGLLRSMAISPTLDQKHMVYLFNQAQLLAKEKSIQSLYLATNKVDLISFFQTFGFTLINKEELSKDLLSSKHVQHILTVDNSLFMELTL